MDLYRQELLDLYHRPHHAGRLEEPTLTVEAANSSCGDRIVLDVQVDQATGKITLAHLTDGCVLSRAGISLLADQFVGKMLDEVKSFTAEQAAALFGTPISAGRLKCALLGWSAWQKAASELKIKN